MSGELKFWQQPQGQRWKKGEGKTTPFASGHRVKGTELKKRSKETKREASWFSESGLRKGGRLQSHLAMTKRLHSGTQGGCDCLR